MDNERLIRILTKKLRGKYNLPHWPLRLDVENAVNEALQQTDELDNLLIQLRNRAVRFSYRKQDGTLREAFGTLKPCLLEEYRAGSKSRSRSTNDCVHYFDLERNAWRCFCPENFITITSFRNLLPRSRNSGVFSVPFTCKGKVCDSSQRIPLPVGQPVARQTSPAVRGDPAAAP